MNTSRRSLPLLLLALMLPTACGGGGGGGRSETSTTIQTGNAQVTLPQTAGIPSDGISGAAIQVLLRDEQGAPLASRSVTVTATGSENTFVPAPTVATGLDGRATVRLSSTRAEQKRITVTADLGSGPVTLAAGVPVGFGRPLVARRRVSVASNGTEANDFSGHAAVSGNGRFVAFMAKADNLVAGDSNQKEDVFVHDRDTGTTERVSLTSSGGQFPDLCGHPSLSDDGLLVAFEGRLADTDAVWLRDRIAGLTTPISDGSGLTGRCFAPMLSGDGRFVAFLNDNGERIQVYVRDRVLGTTSLVSRTPGGGPANGPCFAPSISRNGRWVAFASQASDLVPSDSNEKIDVFVHDRQTGATRLVSRSATSSLGNDDSVEAAIAADGRFVAFASKASNLVPGDDNGKSDVFVVDLATGGIQRASVDAQGREDDKESWLPKLSADGAFVVFSSLADRLVADDQNGKEDVFGRDLAAGTIRRISLARGGGDPNEYSTAPALAADAPVVAFTAKADNLVASDENDQPDVFVAPRQ